MKFTIKSTRLNKWVTFSRPGTGYIYADFNGKAGSEGNQICKHGRFTGSTIAYTGNDDLDFSKVCRTWWWRFTINQSNEE